MIAAAATSLKTTVDSLTDVADYLRLDPVPPVSRELRSYSWDKLRADAVAGAMVAVVTVPQAIAFALIVGLPVQAVLTAAVIGSVCYSLWSTSRHLVFGPTNTVSIILAGALAATAAIPLNVVQKAVLLGFMIGLMQLSAGFFKLGHLTRYISRTVIIAYGTAAGVLIGIGQLTNFLGLSRAPDVSLPGVLRHVIGHLTAWRLNWTAMAIGAAAMTAMLLLRRARPRWPEGLIVLGAAGALTAAYEWLATQFAWPAHTVRLVRDVGEVTGSLPVFVGFPIRDALNFVPQVASLALAAAILGLLETVAITKTLAARSGQKINPNQELMAAGLGNVFSSAFGGMACSASFVRSAVTYESKGATQMAPILSGVFLLVLVAATALLVNYIPVTALAAFVLLIAVRLSGLGQSAVVRRATRSDGLVFWVTFVATLFLSLDTAIYVGMGLSLALFLKKASAPSLVEYSFTAQGQLAQLEDKSERRNAAISIVHVEGELFFGAADLFQEQVRYLADDDHLKVVILRMKNARHLDGTSVMSLLQLHQYLVNSGRFLLVSGINPDVERVLRRSGAWEQLGVDNIFPAEANLTMSTKRALLRASQLLQTAAGNKPQVRLYYPQKQDQITEHDAPAGGPGGGPASDYCI